MLPLDGRLLGGPPPRPELGAQVEQRLELLKEEGSKLRAPIMADEVGEGERAKDAPDHSPAHLRVLQGAHRDEEGAQAH